MKLPWYFKIKKREGTTLIIKVHVLYGIYLLIIALIHAIIGRYTWTAKVDESEIYDDEPPLD